eukprot:536565-Rhodomonas_salina.2
MLLRTAYAMSGTDRGCAATQFLQSCLSLAGTVSAACLQTRYAMSTTDIAATNKPTASDSDIDICLQACYSIS